MIYRTGFHPLSDSTELELRRCSCCTKVLYKTEQPCFQREIAEIDDGAPILNSLPLDGGELKRGCMIVLPAQSLIHPHPGLPPSRGKEFYIARRMNSRG
jgi:hypothetical protein